ncbi:MAG: nucleoside kinase [Candidatus Bipolaricaulota bacterium]|nr:nucleoside kinase [Candidatus Bipolaricaulota bacterium]
MSKRHPQIKPVRARATIQVSLSDGRVFEGQRNTPLREFFRVACDDTENPPVAAIVQGELRELAWPVGNDVTLEPIFLADSDGMKIYCRSLSFLLIVATHELFPNVPLFIDYSVPHGGYFCRIEGRCPFTSEELAKIKGRMRAMVAEDLSIERLRLSSEEAESIFAARGEMGKVRLLKNVNEDHIHLYSLNGFLDYFYGYMVPSTRYLKTFALEPFSDGFILRFPRREDTTRLLPSQRFTALREVFSEYGKWLNVVRVRDVSSLNEAVRSRRIEEVILVSEALHERRIAEIATALADRHDEDHRLVFIAGPSSSGKTTFSKRLSVQLLANGIHPYPLAMDEYFLPRNQLMQEGKEIDFDSFAALDLPFFGAQLRDLLHGKKVKLPHYDFKSGKRVAGPTIKLRPDQILIVEGIHGLNPHLLEGFPEEMIYRIFVSALTQLNLDRHNRIPTTDTRLLRRIVRDAVYRGYDAEETLAMWENVRRGEKQNIFPYQEQADVMFNSALVYELAILKPLVEPLLLQVKRTRPRIEAERLLAFLGWFESYPTGNIPGNSILREFVGGSTLRNFTPEM